MTPPKSTEWEHRLWTEAEVAETFPEGLQNQAAFDAAPYFGEKADILRYEVTLSVCLSV